jgi:hypothetical protein
MPSQDLRQEHQASQDPSQSDQGSPSMPATVQSPSINSSPAEQPTLLQNDSHFLGLRTNPIDIVQLMILFDNILIL